MSAILIRRQYSFSASEDDMEYILGNLADNRININGIMMNRANVCDNFHVDLVLGLPVDTRNDPAWNRFLRELLCCLDISYYKRRIIEVLNPEAGTPGVINRIYTTLLPKFQIYKIYFAENNNILVDVSPVKQAACILDNIFRYDY